MESIPWWKPAKETKWRSNEDDLNSKVSKVAGTFRYDESILLYKQIGMMTYVGYYSGITDSYFKLFWRLIRIRRKSMKFYNEP